MNINVNFLTHQSILIFVQGTLGYVIGHLADTSPEKCALILTIAGVVSTIFECVMIMAEHDQHEFKYSISLIRFCTETIAAITAQRQKLISGQAAL